MTGSKPLIPETAALFLVGREKCGLAREGTKISRMVSGSFLKKISDIIFYNGPEDLEKQLLDVLTRGLNKVRETREMEMTDDSVRVGPRIAHLRRQAGFSTREDFARAIGVPTSLLRSIEEGMIKNIGLKVLCRISHKLGAPLGELFEDRFEPVAPSDNEDLRRLKDTAVELGWSARDFFELRESYERVAAARGEAATVSKADWVKRHSSLENRRLTKGEVEQGELW